MKSLIVQVIYLLSWGALVFPYLHYVKKAQKDHEELRKTLFNQAEKAREDGRSEEAKKLYDAAHETFTGRGLPWYARDYWPFIIIFILGFIVFEAFSYIGLSGYLEVNEDVDYF